jgi:hypothetical protein
MKRMKIRENILKLVVIGVTLFASPLTTTHLMAADVENCDLCHKYSGLGRIDETGKKHLYYVNEKLFQQSVHGKIRCKECHSEIEKYPHTNAKKVDCATVCHLIDPSTGIKKIRVLPRKSWTGVWGVTTKRSGPEHFTITSPTVYTSVAHQEEW